MKNHKIYFCCPLYFSLVVSSLRLNICNQGKEGEEKELLKRRCSCTLQYAGTGYSPASVSTLTPFLCHSYHRYLWPHEVPSVGQEVLFGLLFKTESSQSVLPLVAHHQQYCKEGEWDTEFLVFSTTYVVPILFYRRFTGCLLVIMKVKNCKDFYMLF